MSTIASKRLSRFRMKCVKCDNELIDPEWSEYRSKQQNRHLWRCWKCDSCFETIVGNQDNGRYHDEGRYCPVAVGRITESVQSFTARLHRLNFYVVLRKLIPKLQAFPQCIQKTSMVRFYSSVDSDDVVLIRQTIRDGAFHAIPHQIAADA
jgi:hypothetical protein